MVIHDTPDHAARTGQIELLSKLLDDNHYPRLVAIIEGINNGHKQLTVWAYQHQLFKSRDWFILPFLTGDLDIIIQLGIIPTTEELLAAATHEHINILSWVLTTNVPISVMVIDQLIVEGHYKIMMWLVQQGLRPSPYGLLQLLQKPDLVLLDWLRAYDIIPDPLLVNKIIKEGNTSLIRWLLERRILPDQNGANYALENNDISILQLLLQNNIGPVNIISAVAHNNLPMLKLLYEYHIVPDQRCADISISILSGRNSH